MLDRLRIEKKKITPGIQKLELENIGMAYSSVMDEFCHIQLGIL